MSRLSNRLFDVRIVRFGLVGLLNTALGYGVIVAGLALGWGDFLSNAIGYAAGLAVGFVLNSRWTFGGSSRAGAGFRYIALFAFAYGVNLALIALARSAGFVENPVVHLAAISIYSLLFYLGSAHFVFVPDSNRRGSDIAATARHEGKVS